MKRIFFCLLAVIASKPLFAQTDQLQLDENNKYVYYQVVDKPELSSDSLYARALSFTEKFTGAKAQKSVSVNKVQVTGSTIVYASSLASKKEAGEVKYTLAVEAKPGRYRYKFSDFTFTPYKIDRYGNMVAVPGIVIPLEKLQEKIVKKDAVNIMEQTTAHCKSIAMQVKQAMDKVFTAKKVYEIRKIDTEKW